MKNTTTTTTTGDCCYGCGTQAGELCTMYGCEVSLEACAECGAESGRVCFANCPTNC